MRRHMITLNREEENIKQKKSICMQLESSGEHLVNMDTEKYLLLMKEMEKKGVRFMNVKQTDTRKKAPIIVTGVMIVLMIATIALLLWAAKVDPIPLPFLLLIIAMPIAVIVGVLLALKERMKQIEGGEEDAARKY